MASLPQGAFAACKVRELFSERDMMIARMKPSLEKGESKKNVDNKKLLHYNPVKYNDKLMNSIWGFYNRYSPHNIKSNDYEVEHQCYFVQQPTAVASYAIAESSKMAFNSGEDLLKINKKN